MIVRLAIGLTLLLTFATTTLAQSSSRPLRAAGRVETVAPDSVTILVGGEKMTLAVDKDTKITGRGLDAKAKNANGASPAVIDSLKPSDSVVVKYFDAGGGKLRAAEINVRLISKP